MRCRSGRALAGLAVGALACGRDGPDRLLPPAGATQQAVPVLTSELRAGGMVADAASRNPYADDAAALAAGERLYGTMNCGGCHGPAGGGGIGPPLADADWIYGGKPENIVQSVLQGRPNGMPAFAGTLPASEAWKLAAYVVVLSEKGQAAHGDPRGRAVGPAR